VFQVQIQDIDPNTITPNDDATTTQNLVDWFCCETQKAGLAVAISDIKILEHDANNQARDK
jgi:hypothetical protein